MLFHSLASIGIDTTYHVQNYESWRFFPTYIHIFSQIVRWIENFHEKLFLSVGGRVIFLGQVSTSRRPLWILGVIDSLILCNFIIYLCVSDYCCLLHDNDNNSAVTAGAVRVMANSVQALICSVALVLSTALVTGRIGYGQAPIFKQFFARTHIQLMLLLNMG